MINVCSSMCVRHYVCAYVCGGAYTSSHTCSEQWSPLVYPQICELRKTVQSLCWYTGEKIVIEHQNLQIRVDREVTRGEGGEAVTRHYPAGEERRHFSRFCFLLNICCRL